MAKITSKKDLAGLSIGSNPATRNRPLRKLEVFPNHSRRDYLVELTTDEFTTLCPATGQPDFAKITIRYVPDKKIVESKSLKLYFWSYRDEGAFHEHIVNQMLDDLVAALDPKWCEVIGEFNARGGIGIAVRANYGKRPENC
ncbi:MAG: preQ(1) synthase [Opitutales bacterium]|nr:preQ(1) synthase [Opitutales bacterium]